MRDSARGAELGALGESGDSTFVERRRRDDAPRRRESARRRVIGHLVPGRVHQGYVQGVV